MREAQARTVYLEQYTPPNYLIEQTELHVELFENEALVTAKLSLRRNPDQTGPAPLVLQGRDLELLSLSIDGEALIEARYQLDENSLTIHDMPSACELSTTSRIHPQNNTSLEGLYKSQRMFCTQCEAEGFRKITWYLDRPDVLSTFKTTIVADRNAYPVLLSNGNETGRGLVAGDDSRHWVSWHDPFPKPSYLFALVAGDLSVIEDSFTTCSGRDISLQIFVEAKDLDKCDFALASLKEAMRWDETVYGREYDLDTFMIVAVDDFNMGAMENKGLNIFNSSCVLAKPTTTTDIGFQRIQGIVAHEYFHNWSGNRVTCRDWFQLSLKEGFTVYRDTEFSADMGSRAVKRIEDVNYLRNVQFAEDAGPMAHPVRPESYMEISNFYTVTIYEKGAEVVRMQAQLLGPELFRKGSDLYFERFDGQAVTTEDFIACMEEVSGLDLGLFRRWYTQAGTPVLHVRDSFDAQQERYTLHIRQTCPATPGQPDKAPFHIPLRMGLLDSEGKELPLVLEGESMSGETSRVLDIRDQENTFTFTGIKDKPVPSLLRGFSAPVRLEMDYSRDQLMFLMSHDSDGFVRWEAGQQLALSVIEELLEAHAKNEPLVLDQRLITAYRYVLEACFDEQNDKAMLAQLLLLPSESYIGDQYQPVDVAGIHRVREFVRQTLAKTLQTEFASVFNAHGPSGTYAFSGAEVARRSLRNTVLTYLMLLEDSHWVDVCYQQFERADNMTDSSAALRALINNPGPAVDALRDQALASFYQQWRHEPLVLDQWFALQAGANLPDNLNRVEALIQHEDFNIRNPNKVRAVISAFCHQNLVGFHDPSGAGYHFLATHVLTLNSINPQIAARLLTPLTRWQKFDDGRQLLMRQQLERILQSADLSDDVYEVVSKSLEA